MTPRVDSFSSWLARLDVTLKSVNSFSLSLAILVGLMVVCVHNTLYLLSSVSAQHDSRM
jgi:hypothetical protein